MDKKNEDGKIVINGKVFDDMASGEAVYTGEPELKKDINISSGFGQQLVWPKAGYSACLVKTKELIVAELAATIATGFCAGRTTTSASTHAEAFAKVSVKIAREILTEANVE